MSRILLDLFNRNGSRLILTSILFLLVGPGLGSNPASCRDDPDSKRIAKVTAAEIHKLVNYKADDKVLLPMLEKAFRHGSRRAVQAAANGTFEMKQRTIPLAPAMVHYLKTNPNLKTL